jgi:hypothetical protein
VSMLALQLEFAATMACFLAWAEKQGHRFKFGDAWRSDEQAAINALGEEGRRALAALIGTDPRFHALARALVNNGKGTGIFLSVHCDACALDLVLCELDANGKASVVQNTARYRPLGLKWESMHPLARWGGRFQDFGHFSFEIGGRK